MNNRTIAALVAAAALTGAGVIVARSSGDKGAAAAEIVGVDITEAPTVKTMPKPDRRKAAAQDDAYKTAKVADEACACARGPACAWWRSTPGGEREVVKAPAGITLGPGTWRGSDCLPKACLNHGADDTWPKACPVE